MKITKKALIINWITVALWIWALLCTWSVLPIPEFLKPNIALATFFILVLQVFAHCNIKTILCLKDKETNLIAIIGIATVICLFLAHSNPGAFFSVMNLCLLWYLSDKWVWDKKQIITMGIAFLYLYIIWMYNPILFGDNTNPNGTGTISAFLALTLICCIKYIFPNKKWTLIIESILVILSLGKLLIFHGRGTLIGLTLYIILRLLAIGSLWTKENFHKILCYTLTLGSLIFVFIYTLIWRTTDLNFTIPFWNKTIFTGREKIWFEIWTYFKSQPLIGIGSNVTLQSWFEYNVHNAIYNILVTHGIIVFIFVISYMIKKMINLYSKYNQCPIYVPVVSGVFAIYMESFFDMDLIWFPIFLVWSFMLVILCSASAKDKHEPAPKEYS